MIIWTCTACGAEAPVEPTPMLDGSYGTTRCASDICKRQKRVFHKEVNQDDDRSLHVPVSERPTQREG